MKEKIISGLSDPVTMEKLYRENKSEFRTSFLEIFPQIQNSQLAKFWSARLREEIPRREDGDTLPDPGIAASARRF
ncbi:MAG TPA: hypothetical protein PKA39_08145, partial [Ignavibacteria bacterium]|nr:hypothetical protein [Ignavibacteria bacterium]